MLTSVREKSSVILTAFTVNLTLPRLWEIRMKSSGVETIVAAIQKGLLEHDDIDFLTITANGEPTLYPHLSELIDEINKI